MKYPWAIAALIALITACKPPPTDADMGRDMPDAEPAFASDPLPSPDTEGAVWALADKDQRLIYGIPGQPVLLALACLRDGPETTLRITRMSPADKGAGAMLALIGNGAIGRMEVDATEVSGRVIWQGEDPASDEDWEPLAGPRQLTATIPGAGMVTLNPSPLPMQLVSACRSQEPPKALDPEKPAP